jgi:asparagine synthase (glutamine-hydrolysing)
MAQSLVHRGPDDEGYLFKPGFGFASRRLSIVGLGDGHQPIFNEDGSVAVVYNGELFDYPERKAELQAKGHVFKTHTDTELIVHLYEEHGEDVFSQLRGQFAVALIDFRRRIILLGRDRVGICPLNWSQQGDWLYFGSEVKALLAGGVKPEIDPRGLDHIFTFFALGGRRTMFAGVQSVLPGHYLKIAFRSDGKRAEIAEHRYWDFDFPDAGTERDPSDEPALIDEFEAKFRRAVEIRLRADVPVVGYLSGGVDSAYALATASIMRGSPVPSFTIQVPGKGFDETDAALRIASHIGARPTVLRSDARVISDTYARLVASADCPVPDTSCAALWCLSQEVHKQGYKVALTGEGSDEAFGGYVWFKIRHMSRLLEAGGILDNDIFNTALLKFLRPQLSPLERKHLDVVAGRGHAQTVLYHLVARGRDRYFSADLKERIGAHMPYEDVPLDRERMRRWSPLNQSIYFGYKVHLAGQLLNYKGDRVAMANSVETRYPYLDEDFIAFVSQLAPRWKLRGLRDKYILRHAAARVLPREDAFRAKAMFRAPLAETFLADAPAFVRQLMSPESLARTGYFDPETVGHDYALIASGRAGKVGVFKRLGLSGVVSTQLWHHLYLGGGLCDLPEHAPAPMVERPSPLRVTAPAAE